MSTCLRETENVHSKKHRRCSLGEERIDAGQPHFVRIGVSCGDLWEMRIHPECHALERDHPPSADWYEDPDCSAFSRADAIDAARAKEAKP